MRRGADLGDKAFGGGFSLSLSAAREAAKGCEGASFFVCLSFHEVFSCVFYLCGVFSGVSVL